jgi:NitT/TauT family transport system permease protein
MLATTAESPAEDRTATSVDDLLSRADEELAGLDALETVSAPRHSFASQLWAATWPKVAAVLVFLAAWQAVVASGWKPEYVLPGPKTVLTELWTLLRNGTVLEATQITMRRAAVGYAVAVFVGVLAGSLITQSKILRSACASMITGLQTMPSIAWFPISILVFKLSEQAITSVVVLGAAPAIANGLISGADQIPPIQLRAAQVLGARGWNRYRLVVLPASMPGFVAGLKQGWAFAWRSLMAGELIVIVIGQQSIGALMQTNRNLNDAAGLMAWMIVIFTLGVVIDAAVFGRLDSMVRRRFGLVDRS